MIKGLRDVHGEWKTDKRELMNITTDYFSQIFSTSSPYSFDDALCVLNRVVTENMNEMLDKESNAMEIREALFNIHPTKAPRPDIFHAIFFQTFWEIVGGDVVALVQNWWRGNIRLNDINRTYISLIPKCNELKLITEYRPISCCNVIYKIISKVLANKLKYFLGDIISLNQSAFIPKRLITDNALIAFEVFHAMKNNRSPNNISFALKLDMSKAYNRIEWSFLERVMHRMGFNDGWVNRIMSCITSVSFSFKLNGQIFGNLTPSRGLRQGDPISPYLFLIDAFSTLIHRATTLDQIHGVRICRGAPMISHMFFADDSIVFADDSIVFAETSLHESYTIARIISAYERLPIRKSTMIRRKFLSAKGFPLRYDRRLRLTLGLWKLTGTRNILVCLP